MNIDVKNSIKTIDYHSSMKILEKRVLDVYKGKKNEFLWLLEHKSVYTAGTSSKNTDIIDKEINIIKTNRGGKHTFHGPGQKIAYFVLNLNNRKKDVRLLVNNLEQCIIDVLEEYNINAFRDKGNVGIWVKDKNKIKKIAAIGIRVRKWIAYHGFALNINNDLKKFESIVPCGIKNKGVINLEKLGINEYSKINDIITKKFLNIFH